MNNHIVIIDPGHGGHDAGAVNGSAQEKDVNLRMASLLGATLGRCGVAVAFTRVSDTFVSLEDRAGLEQKTKPSCFVSLHCNNWNTTTPRGFEIFTTPGATNADALATSMQLEIAQLCPDVPWRLDETDGDPDKEAGFFVLKNTHSPAVLMEMGFLSNAEDLMWISAKANQERLALAMASGIIKYLL